MPSTPPQRRPASPRGPPTPSTLPHRPLRPPRLTYAIDAAPLPVDATPLPICVPREPPTARRRRPTAPRGPPTLSTPPCNPRWTPSMPTTAHCCLLPPPHTAPTSLACRHPRTPVNALTHIHRPTIQSPSLLPHASMTPRAKPMSTRSATKAQQQELVVEIPVPKKQTKSKKKKITTSADRDAADEEANETTVEHLTATARTLQESGAPLAPPARRVGTGVTLAPITPSIITSRIRREESDDVPQIASKDKGKGRDLTNLGSSDAEEEIDEGEDDEEKKSDDEEEKDLDVDLGDEEDGEPKKTDDEDDNEIDDGEVTNPADLPDSDDDTMEVDPTTPKRPTTPANPTTASKRRASTSPITARQMGKGLRKGITHASASSRPAPPSPTSDDLEDLQGASRTMGGIARGKAMGVALNMADFDANKESDAPPVMGMLYVFEKGASPLKGAGPVGVKVPIKNTLGPVLTAAAKRMVALISSDILLWDAQTLMWEAKGPYAIAVDDNEAVIWDDKNVLRIGIQPSVLDLSYLPPPSPSINSSSTSSAVSSIAPSASISVAGTSTTPVSSLITAFPNDPLLLRIATRMEVPLHMTNSGKGNGGLVNMYARYQLAVGAMAKWNRLTTPWDGAPVEEALLRSIFIKRTNFGTYGALFKRCLKFPMLMDMLQNPDYNFASEAHTKVWGGREVGRMTLGKVLDELEAELAAEEARVVAEKAKKARDAKKKSAAKKATK
ncbi:hypothetical protein EYR40_010498 [Pleurotus pulmonarius]|nr:hypothetical protein EYR40_010498 [Pleurotus pulmonarius]